jgi:hypothetical protein
MSGRASHTDAGCISNHAHRARFDSAHAANRATTVAHANTCSVAMHAHRAGFANASHADAGCIAIKANRAATTSVVTHATTV